MVDRTVYTERACKCVAEMASFGTLWLTELS